MTRRTRGYAVGGRTYERDETMRLAGLAMLAAAVGATAWGQRPIGGKARPPKGPSAKAYARKRKIRMQMQRESRRRNRA